jgi:O-acetylhomoserine/O-acetylserine sulfhydrylase-like pyridoxal-dependent enzyme
MLVGIDDLHLDINREGIYTGILQPVKVFYMLVGIDDLHLDINREIINADQHVEDLNWLKDPCIYTLPLDI